MQILSKLAGCVMSAVVASAPVIQDGKAQFKSKRAQSPTARVCYHDENIPYSVKPILSDAWKMTKQGIEDQTGVTISEVDHDCVHVTHPELIDKVKASFDDSAKTGGVLPDHVLEETYMDDSTLASHMRSTWDVRVQTGVQTIKNNIQDFEDDIINNVVMRHKRPMLAMAGRRAYRGESQDTIEVYPYMAAIRYGDATNTRQSIIRNAAKLYAHELGHSPFHLLHPRDWNKVSVYDGIDVANGSCGNVMNQARAHPDSEHGFRFSQVQAEITRRAADNVGEYEGILDESDAIDIYQEFSYVSSYEYRCGLNILAQQDPQVSLSR